MISLIKLGDLFVVHFKVVSQVHMTLGICNVYILLLTGVTR
jgi:hypothetical protein